MSKIIQDLAEKRQVAYRSIETDVLKEIAAANGAGKTELALYVGAWSSEITEQLIVMLRNDGFTVEAEAYGSGIELVSPQKRAERAAESLINSVFGGMTAVRSDRRKNGEIIDVKWGLRAREPKA